MMLGFVLIKAIYQDAIDKCVPVYKTKQKKEFMDEF